jgi:two-component system response regulator MprA
MDVPYRRPLVLLVDDDLRTSRMLARLLREDGYDVELADDSEAAALRLSRRPSPDAIVTDLVMGGIGGVGVARCARDQRPQMPVFVLTGYPQLLGGFRDLAGPPPIVFTKPLDYDALTEQLRDTIVASRETIGTSRSIT